MISFNVQIMGKSVNCSSIKAGKILNMLKQWKIEIFSWINII